MSKKRLIYGCGYNDCEESVSVNKRVNGKLKTMWRCPYYSKWVYMLKRCYGKNSYSNCKVCEEWLTFSNFKSWMKEKDWEGKELDKDIMKGSLGLYSPDTCLFIDKDVNSFVLTRPKFRGSHPLGVCYDKVRGLYQSHCNLIVDGERKSKNLGRYKTPEEAHRAWQLAKRDRALQLQAEQTDSRVIGGLQRIIDKLQHDYDNNLETKTL